MPGRTVRARLDSPSEEALRRLTASGLTESQAVRLALIETSERARRRSGLRAEVRALRDDPLDTAERLALLSDLDALTPELPE